MKALDKAKIKLIKCSKVVILVLAAICVVPSRYCLKVQTMLLKMWKLDRSGLNLSISLNYEYSFN